MDYRTVYVDRCWGTEEDRGAAERGGRQNWGAVPGRRRDQVQRLLIKAGQEVTIVIDYYG